MVRLSSDDLSEESDVGKLSQTKPARSGNRAVLSGKETVQKTQDKKKARKKRKAREDSESEGDTEKKKRRKHARDSRKKKNKKKRARSSSSSSEEPSSSSEDSEESSESEDSDSDSDKPSPQSGKKKRKGKKRDKVREKVDWELLNIAWPIEDRPVYLRKRENVRGRDIDALVRLKREVIGEEEKKELGDSAFCRDAVVKKTKFKAAKDDGYTKLHPARAARQPLAVPRKWFSKLVPVKRTTIVRNFPLEHYGAAGQVSDKTLGKMHNRAVDLPFEQFCKQSVLGAKDADLSLRQIEAGVLNYCAVLHALWPQDYSALALHRVLFDANWGEGSGLDEKRRAKLVKLFATEILKINAGRAVREMHPLEYEDIRAKWTRTMEAHLPGGVAAANFSLGGGAGAGDGSSRGRGRGRGRGGAAPPAVGVAVAAGGGRGRGGGGGRIFGPPAQVSGTEVCFRFNSVAGCQRVMATAKTCKEGSRLFVHACDWLDPISGKHCLKDHARHLGGH